MTYETHINDNISHRLDGDNSLCINNIINKIGALSFGQCAINFLML